MCTPAPERTFGKLSSPQLSPLDESVVAYCSVQLENSMGVIVVCDTNVFVHKTHILRKKGGLDLVRLLRATDGHLFIPEILQTECMEQTAKTADTYRGRLEGASSALDSLIGFQLPLPTSDAIFKAANKAAIDRLRALEPITLTAPLNTEILEAAGRRTIAARKPTSKSDHGYKDCLIWEGVLRLPPGSDVRLVSHDGAFFDGEQLAQELVDEARARDIKVTGYKKENVEDLVRDIRAANPTLDLSIFEAQDLTAPEDITVPTTPSERVATSPDQLVPDLATAGADVQEVACRLADVRKRFEELDLRILAYIAYLDPAGRDQLFQLLNQVKIPTDMAKNSVERLVLGGFVRDIGNHYLVADRAVAEVVAPTVENEIIDLLGKDSGGHGH